MSQRYFEFASRPAVLGATFVLTVLLLVGFNQVPIGGELLDVRPGYDTDTAMAALDGYGADGRRIYFWSSLTLDTLLPLCYATFLAGILHWLAPHPRLRFLKWLPLVLCLVDFGENAQIMLMLLQFPEVSPGQIGLASTFTQIKGPLFAACFGLALVVVVIALVRRATQRAP